MTTLTVVTDTVREAFQGVLRSGLLGSPYVRREIEETLREYLPWLPLSDNHECQVDCDHNLLCNSCDADCEDEPVYCGNCYRRLEEVSFDADDAADEIRELRNRLAPSLWEDNAFAGVTA